jgi:chromosome segregation ATPase
MSEQRFTDEQLDEIVRSLDFCSGSCDHRAVGAIAALRSRVSLLEGERNEARQMAQVNFLDLSAEKQARLKAESEVAALRSQLDEARRQYVDARTALDNLLYRLPEHAPRSQHIHTPLTGEPYGCTDMGDAWLLAERTVATLNALDVHHGEPK